MSAAARLVPLADHLGIEVDELLSWLKQQDAEFVGDFVEDALHQVTPDDEGQFSATNSDGDLIVGFGRQGGRVVDITDDGKVVVNVGGIERTISAESIMSGTPNSLAGIAMWAEIFGHPMPIG